MRPCQTPLKVSDRGLNPCCNGIYSMSQYEYLHGPADMGLNPCCNGIYSMRNG